MPLAPNHAKLILESGISELVAAARGYETITKKKRLEELGFAPVQRRVPALLIPVRNVAGEIATYQIRPDEPRLKRSKPGKLPKPLKYETRAGDHMALDVPPTARTWLPDRARPLFVTEGARKADSAVSRGLCCIALLGVWNWRGTNSSGGKSVLADWDSIALNDREVYIAFDSDVMEKEAVATSLVRLKSFLETRKANVKLIYLPAGDGGAKIGLDDYFALGRSVDELLALATTEVRPGTGGAIVPFTLTSESAPNPGGSSPSSSGSGSSKKSNEPIAKIIISTKIADMADVVESTILRSPKSLFLFQQAGRILELARDGHGASAGAPADAPVVTRDVGVSRLVDISSRIIEWVKLKSSDEGDTYSAARPDKEALGSLLSRATWKFRYLRGLSPCPCLRPDGTILSTPGYDDETGLVMTDNKTKYPKFTSKPSRDDARAALQVLEDLFVDFPFLKPSDRAAAIAGILTLVARHAIAGPVPLFLVRSPTPGTGKSLLVDVISMIATGTIADRYILAADAEEERKTLFAIALESAALALFDNLARPLGSPALDATLTSQRVAGRIMATNRNAHVAFTTTLFATGNNLQVKGDLARRVLVIDLDAEVERPEEQRTKPFRHANILEYTKLNRAKLIASALTLLRAHHCAGQPQPHTSIGGFEAWDKHVRQPIAWVSDVDAAEGRVRVREESNPELDVLRELLVAWNDALGNEVGYTIHQVISEVSRANSPGALFLRQEKLDRLREAIAALDPRSDPDRPDARKLGYALRKYKGRIVDNLKIDSGGHSEKGALWRCVFRNEQLTIRVDRQASSGLSSGTQNVPPQSVPQNPDDPDDTSSLYTRAHTHAHTRIREIGTERSSASSGSTGNPVTTPVSSADDQNQASSAAKASGEIL